MSSDDHGHGSGHGHDSDAPADIIPLGSWQDNLLALISVLALAGLCWFASGFVEGIKVLATPAHHAEAGHEGHGAAATEATHGVSTEGEGHAGGVTDQSEEHNAVSVPSTETSAPNSTEHPASTLNTKGTQPSGAEPTGAPVPGDAFDPRAPQAPSQLDSGTSTEPPHP